MTARGAPSDPRERVRPMEFGDIPAGLALCRAAGWNQIADDWSLYLQHSRSGAQVVLEAGEIAGTVTAVDYQQRFAWIGMVLVDQRFRRQGLGTRLLQLAIEHLASCETIKLDATPAGRPVYLPLGFVEEYGLLRMQTVAQSLPPQEGVSVRRMNGEDLPAVLAWDAQVFGADRGSILTRYRELAPGYAGIAMRDATLVGYCFGRHGFRWEQAGPIVATDRLAAQALLAATLSANAGKPFLVDTRLADPDWVAWLRQAGFVEQRPYTRMVKGPNRHPGVPGQQYAILGPELG
jgi:GNAT superfamily N-acetyltransferase